MGKKRVLVTGAAGFIGFHAALALKARSDEVVGLDNFNSYYSLSLKRARSNHLATQAIEVIECDLTERERLQNLFEKFAPTHVLHLAAQAGVRYARTHPDSYITSNIEGFLSLLEVLRGFTHVKLIYASSSSVYGCNKETPFSEKDRVDAPANLYAATKRANELMAYSYHNLYGIAMTGLRFFTVYGPWGRPDMAYYSFTEAMKNKQPITLFNQGKMSRDFTYIDDIVEGILASIDLGANYEIFNLGNHKPVELLTFVKLLEKAVGMQAKIRLSAPSPGEVETTFADISHAKKMLGYKPKTSLEEGLSHFAKWHSSFGTLFSP